MFGGWLLAILQRSCDPAKLFVDRRNLEFQSLDLRTDRWIDGACRRSAPCEALQRMAYD
jgi:hypothetical protein